MKATFGKVLASTLFAGALAISAPVSAGNLNAGPVDILCQTLHNGIEALIKVGQVATLEQAATMVDQMVSMGCQADLIPTLPLL